MSERIPVQTRSYGTRFDIMLRHDFSSVRRYEKKSHFPKKRFSGPPTDHPAVPHPP
jgi:hypothetical protein